MLIGVSLALPNIRPAGASLHAEASAVIGAMSSTPDSTRQGLINAAIGTMKTAGAWTKMGIFGVFMAHAEQAALLDWVNPTGTPFAKGGAPTHTTDRGFAGDGVDDFIDSQRAWNTITGVAQDNAHAGGYMAFGGSNSQAGVGIAGSSNVQIGRTSGNMSSRLNNSTITTADAVSATAGAHLGLSRSSSAGFDRYIDGAAVTAAVQASSAVSTGNFVGLRSNALFSAPTLSLRVMHAGAALTASEMAAVRSALQTFAAEVGAN
jgi:hypothetical protein